MLRFSFSKLEQSSRSTFISRVTLIAFAISILIAGAGCATLVQPSGEWSQPSDLPLNTKSLEGISTQVRCGTLMPDGKVRERTARICTYLETSLSQLGTEIIKRSESLPPNLTLWYLETNRRESRSSPFTWWAFAFTFGLIPGVTTNTAEAEMRVLDSRGVILHRETLRVEQVQTVGWVSLVTWLTQKQSAKERQREVERLFLRHVQNQVYSQSMRLTKGVSKSEALR